MERCWANLSTRTWNIEFWTEERPQTLQEKANAVHLTTLPNWTVTGIGDTDDHDWLKMVTSRNHCLGIASRCARRANSGYHRRMGTGMTIGTTTPAP